MIPDNLIPYIAGSIAGAFFLGGLVDAIARFYRMSREVHEIYKTVVKEVEYRDQNLE